METTEKQAGLEVTSVRVPIFVAVLNPTIPDVPAKVMFPLASGADVLGRTWIPCHINVFVRLLMAVTTRVIVDAEMEDTAIDVPLATPLMFLEEVALPVNKTVTVAPVLNSNPDGAFRMTVPSPTSPALVSVTVGPVNADQEPAALQATAVLEATEPPPVAGVNVAAFAPPPMAHMTSNQPKKNRPIQFGQRMLHIPNPFAMRNIAIHVLYTGALAHILIRNFYQISVQQTQ
jgi:hypothetical protein